MSEHVAQLAALLVQELYGELYERLYQAVLHCGRANVQTIQNSARLTARQVKYGLCVLIQQHLLHWYTPSPKEPTMYEANLLAAYRLVRIGNYVQTAQDRFGAPAGDIISRLWLLGHSRFAELSRSLEGDLSDMVPEPLLGTRSGKGGKAYETLTEHQQNQEAAKDAFSPYEIDGSLNQLFQFGLISPVHESVFRSEADNNLELEKAVPSIEHYKAKSKKEKQAMRDRKLNEMRLEWRYGAKFEGSVEVNSSSGMKRLLDEPFPVANRKRPKLNASNTPGLPVTNNHEERRDHPEAAHNGTFVVSINHDKFDVLARNKLLVDFVDQRLGKSSAKIYQFILRKLEHSLRACRESASLVNHEEVTESQQPPGISTDTIVANFPDPTEFIAALGEVEDDWLETKALEHPKKRRRKLSEGNGYSPANRPADLDSESDEEAPEYKMNDLFDSTKSTGPITQHLLLLASHPDRLLQHTFPTSTKTESWTVDYAHLSRVLARHTLFETITSRFGTTSCRLARICQEKGRLDDKTLCSLSLLSQKELRSRLLALQRAGMLEQQEVPRDNARVASRTTFLYYFDEERCTKVVLENCYKTMVRFLQRLEVERAKVAGVLDKIERSDVKGREAELLGDKEKEALTQWRGEEERIWGELGRIDTVVGILRDF